MILCISIHLYMYPIYTYQFVYTAWIFVYVLSYVCIYIYIYIYVCIIHRMNIYIYNYISMHVYIYIYTVIYVGASSNPWSYFDKKLICFKIQMHQSLGEFHGRSQNLEWCNRKPILEQGNSSMSNISDGSQEMASIQHWNPGSRVAQHLKRTTHWWPPSVSTTRGHKVLIVTSLEGLRAISLDKASHKNLEKALKLNINPQPVATVATEPWHSTWTPWKTANSWLESDWWRCTAHNMPKIQEVFKFLISSSHTSNKNMTSEFKKKNAVG